MASLRERQRKAPPPGPGQMRFDLYTGKIGEVKGKERKPTLQGKTEQRTNFGIIPQEIMSKEIHLRRKKESPKKPLIAYINSENLGIIRDRINFKGSNRELIESLVVFWGSGNTQIKFKKEQEPTTILLSSLIAIERSADPDEIPWGDKMYEGLGIYTQATGTGKPSTDRATSHYAFIQRDNINHPSHLALGRFFFASPNSAIKVDFSKKNETGFFFGSRK